MEEIKDRVKRCVSIVCRNDMDDSSISDDITLTDDLGFDSIMMIELIVELEDEFEIEIDEDDITLDEINDISSLIELVQK